MLVDQMILINDDDNNNKTHIKSVAKNKGISALFYQKEDNILLLLQNQLYCFHTAIIRGILCLHTVKKQWMHLVAIISKREEEEEYESHQTTSRNNI